MNRTTLRKNYDTIYKWLLRNDRELLNKYFPLTPVNVWTLEACKTDALKYTKRGEWKNSSSAYGAACKKGWLKECCGHMEESRTGRKWTLETCKHDALKYKTRKEWQLNSSGAYCSAFDNKWLESCCSHMKPDLHIGRNKITVNLDTGEIFPSAIAAENKYALRKQGISASIGRKTKCGGYRWAYCDENGNVEEK